MTMETLLPKLQKNPLCQSVLKKLDDTSREKLIACIKTAAVSERIEDIFFDCCDEAGLSDVGSLGTDDQGKLSASDIDVFATELVKLMKQQ
jgi:hypothetical protein